MPVIGREKQEDPSVRPAWFMQWVPGCPVLCSERLCLKKSPRLMEITNCVSLKYSVPIGTPLAKRTSLSQYAFLCSPTCSWFLSFVDGTSCIDHSVSPRTGSPLCVLYHFNGHKWDGSSHVPWHCSQQDAAALYCCYYYCFYYYKNSCHFAS